MWAAIAAVARAAAGESTGRAARLNAVGDAVEAVVDAAAREHGHRLGILEDYVGHGIGTSMHMAPDVLNYSNQVDRETANIIAELLGDLPGNCN